MSEESVAQEFPGLIEMNPEGEEPGGPTRVQQLMMRLLQTLMNLMRQGMPLDHIRINPELKPEFLAELDMVPDHVLSPETKAKLTLVEDPDEPDLRVVTFADVEREFLVAHFGEEGNRLLPRLGKHLRDRGYPVMVNLDFLRTLFLLEETAKLGPGIVHATTVPPGAGGLLLPGR